MTYSSEEILNEVERQAQRALAAYDRYHSGPQFRQQQNLEPSDIGRLIIASLMSIFLYFTMQAEVYVNRGLVQAIINEKDWLAGVLAILAAGFFCSFIIAEQLPATRILPTGPPAPRQADAIDVLVDKVKGVTRRGGDIDWRRYSLIFVGLMVAIITALAAQQAMHDGNWSRVIFPPMLFIFDVGFGVGPVYLLSFGTKRWYVSHSNRRAQQHYDGLHKEWFQTSELFKAADARYRQEMPEVSNTPYKLPPINPLAGFIISHPCHKDIVIPTHVLKGREPPPAEASTAKPESPPPSGATDPIAAAQDVISAIDFDSDPDIDNDKLT